MQRNFYIQPNYFVGEDRACISVAESGDFPGDHVCIFTKDAEDIEYFGKLRLDMPIEYMRLLAKTILRVCDEVEAYKEQK